MEAGDRLPGEGGGDGEGRARPVASSDGDPATALGQAAGRLSLRTEGEPAEAGSNRQPAEAEAREESDTPPAWQLETLRSRKGGECLNLLAERVAALPGAAPNVGRAQHFARPARAPRRTAAVAGVAALPPTRARAFLAGWRAAAGQPAARRRCAQPVQVAAARLLPRRCPRGRRGTAVCEAPLPRPPRSAFEHRPGRQPILGRPQAA